MTTLIYAEKSSVAREIAKIVNATRRQDGYFEGNHYCVTWGIGHLVSLAEPDELNSAWGGQWNLDVLPMIPDEFKLVPIESVKKQLQIVSKLFHSCSEIINATDAGREGENIFRLVYRFVNCKKPVKRLWISSTTEEAIRIGLKNLRPGADFDHLADAAWCRQKADWLIGMNLTRAYSVHHEQLCTIGRVQTPTLALIVEREAKIKEFKKGFYYEIHAQFDGFIGKRIEPATNHTRIDDRDQAQRIWQSLLTITQGTVASIETKPKVHHAPQLFNLVTLQKECNKRFSLTAAETLEAAQELYEKFKLLSYPRSGSRYISDDMVDGLPTIINGLPNDYNEFIQQALRRLKEGHKLSKSYVDNQKLTDHHAIIPTGQSEPINLPQSLKQVYRLVVEQFLAIFLPDYLIDETTTKIKIDINTDKIGIGQSFTQKNIPLSTYYFEYFRAKGLVVKQLGWKSIAEHNPTKDRAACIEDSDDESSESKLPILSNGQLLEIKQFGLKEYETNPPLRYNDASLLDAMVSAGKYIPDEELAKNVKLGSDATRAEVFERLIESRYVVREKKWFIPTKKGINLINCVDQSLKTPELTAQWEQQLHQIEDGQLSPKIFEQNIKNFLVDIIPTVIKTIPMPLESKLKELDNLGVCPSCKEGLIYENKKSYYCNAWKNKGCKFSIWKEIAHKAITKNQVHSLLTKRQTHLIKGFKNKEGNEFNAFLKLEDNGKITFVFESTKQSNHGDNYATTR